MKAAALLVSGVALGWAMRTGGADAWVAVTCAAGFGFLLCLILLGAELALRISRAQR